MLALPIFALIFAIPFSHAGKLAQGFRGQAFGALPDLELPYANGCRGNTKEDRPYWECDVKLGEIPVTVRYYYQNKVFWAVSIDNRPLPWQTTARAKQACPALFSAFIAAYGEPLDADQNNDLPLYAKWQDSENPAVYAFWEVELLGHLTLGGYLPRCTLRLTDTSLRQKALLQPQNDSQKKIVDDL